MKLAEGSDTPQSLLRGSSLRVETVGNLLEHFDYGNWEVRTGFVYKDLAFVEQVSGGNEWLTLKKVDDQWIPFESLSMYHMLKQSGGQHCREFIEGLANASIQELKPGYTAPEPVKSDEHSIQSMEV